MERIILMIIKRFFVAPIWFYQICKYGNENHYSEEERYAVVHKIVKKINKAGNVTVYAEGLENLPKKNGYIMFPNHQGLFDALAILDTHKKPFSVVLKKEISNNFFIKRVICLLRAQVIDRSDIRQSLGVINQMTKEVKNGRNYLIFAEGTRSKKQNELLDFKGGTFKSAVNAKCPIIPVAIIDSYKVFDTKSIKKEMVKVYYLEPIYYDEYKNIKTVEIAKLVKNRIENKIKSISF